MSTSDTIASVTARPGQQPAPVAPVPAIRRGRRPDLRLLRSELALVMQRRRNLALLAVLALPPIAIGLAVRSSSPGSVDGPAFLGQVTDNGLFLVFTSLTVMLPFFLPLAVAVASGEAIAGEANIGTLRNLLVVPVGRTRLLLVKYAGVVAFAVACTVTVALVGLVVGLVLFPHGDVTLLSGTSISFASALGRAVLVAAYVAVMLAGVSAIGLFASTLTEVPMGAMAATAVLAIASEILDAIPQISWLGTYLFTHSWTNYGDLLRAPLDWSGVQTGLLTQVAYIAVFLSLAWARLTTKDITS